ncbi:uracil-DNA glycosylase family protein [Streptomyces sp. NPDC054864]
MIKAATGLISPLWCTEHYAEVLCALPAGLTEADVTRPELLLYSESIRGKRLEIYFTPFDQINTKAKVVFVGITPGAQQMSAAVREARAALREGTSVDEAIRRADLTASFVGPMRTNAVRMLDDIGLAKALQIPSTRLLFDAESELAASTSAISHAVFLDGENYGGAPSLARTPILRAFAEQVLAGELEACEDALIVPFGKTASQAVNLAMRSAGLPSERVLLGFPHPSGQNGHRVRFFAREREQLCAAVAAWAPKWASPRASPPIAA